MICEKCGNQVTEGASFCTMCGNRLKPAGDATEIRPGGENYVDASAYGSANPVGSDSRQFGDLAQNTGKGYGQPYDQNAGNGYGQPYDQNAGKGYGQPYDQNAGNGYGQTYDQNAGNGYGQSYGQNAGYRYNQVNGQNSAGSYSQPAAGDYAQPSKQQAPNQQAPNQQAPNLGYMKNAMDAAGNYYLNAENSEVQTTGAGAFLQTKLHFLIWGVCALLAVGILFQAVDIARVGSGVRDMESTYITSDFDVTE